MSKYKVEIKFPTGNGRTNKFSDQWLTVDWDITAKAYSQTIHNIQIQPIERGRFIGTLLIAQKYNLQFVDRFDQIKTLTDLERIIWSIK